MVASSGRRDGRWRMLLGLGVIGAALFLLEPTRGGVLLFGRPLPDLCPLAAAGGACPACGTTRALLLLARCRFAEAWDLQPAAFLLLLLPVLPVAGSRLGARRLAAARRLLAAAFTATAVLSLVLHG